MKKMKRTILGFLAIAFLFSGVVEASAVQTSGRIKLQEIAMNA